jgi:predicted phage baseplate assembly protein
MPLPTPQLDDRHSQDIVDQAKRLIPLHTREWTDHNVSDPGVTLIELFAWMTDMLLYRVNQVPDKNYIKFLELIGMTLEEPRAATAPVTFYLSAAQPTTVTIPVNTEVATVRTETNPAIIFTTESALTVRLPALIDTFTRNASSRDPWIRHNIQQSKLLKREIPMFPPRPGPGDSFLLAFENDLSNHILALILNCEVAGGAGVDPKNPPIQWQVWRGVAARWVACEQEYDGTGGFNDAGEVILHLPAMTKGEFQGINAYWLRCRVIDSQSGMGSYKRSPVVLDLAAESRGGTVNARHAITVQNETLGASDGTPGQSFKLLHTPILSLDRQQDYLSVEPPDGTSPSETWKEVDDFGDANENDQHFTLDKLDGTLTLGPALLQPEGMIRSFGKVPEKGSVLRFRRYQYGGGAKGNLSAGTLTVLKSSIPYIAHVTNRAPAVGGRDEQSLDDARLLAPQYLRTRTRAVTADDYEFLASQVSGVARARCIGPGAQPGDRNDPRPGQVVVAILPRVDRPEERIKPEQLVLSAELQSAVVTELDKRRLLGTQLDVRQPQFVYVSVQAELHVPERSDPRLIEEVQQRAVESLYRYINPYIGGPQGDGWPFGRALNRSEIFGLLQGIDSVEYVENVQISISDAGAAAPAQGGSSLRSVPVARTGLICSGLHQVKVS